MKFTDEDRERLERLVKTFDTEERRQAYRVGDFTRSHLAQDVDRRYRWDTLWLAADARQAFDGNREIYSILEDYLDEHINTALKSFIPPIEDLQIPLVTAVPRARKIG